MRYGMQYIYMYKIIYSYTLSEIELKVTVRASE